MDKKSEEQTRVQLVKKWFINVKKHLTNEEILIIQTNQDNKKYLQDHFHNSEYTNLKIDELFLLKDSKLNERENINLLFIEDSCINLYNLTILEKKNTKILFIKITNKNDFINLLESDKLENKTLCKNSKFFYLQKQPYSSTITDNIKYAEFFILHLLKNNDKLSFSIPYVENALLRNIRNVTLETILNDIEYFYFSNVLTSRLAIFVYKLSTFNLRLSDKTIGTIYAKKYNSSKVFNNKRFNISNTKGYYIGERIKDVKVKKNIANNLIKLTHLSFEDIAKVTELNIDIVESLKYK